MPLRKSMSVPMCIDSGRQGRVLALRISISSITCVHAIALRGKQRRPAFIVGPISKAFLSLSSDVLRIISLGTEHLKINLRNPQVQGLIMNTGVNLAWEVTLSRGTHLHRILLSGMLPRSCYRIPSVVRKFLHAWRNRSQRELSFTAQVHSCAM